jgi:hypothetical protein
VDIIADRRWAAVCGEALPRPRSVGGWGQRGGLSEEDMEAADGDESEEDVEAADGDESEFESDSKTARWDAWHPTAGVVHSLSHRVTRRTLGQPNFKTI